MIQLVHVARIDPHHFGADHAAFPGWGRSTYLDHASRKWGRFPDASDTSTVGGVAFCSGMAPSRLRTAWREIHRRMRVCNPNA